MEPPRVSRTSTEDEAVDEAVAESFPASDAPAWTASHLGAPAPRPWALEHAHELRASLRVDLERLARADANPEQSGSPREDAIARSILDAGRSVIREPIDPNLRARNVESELLGADRDQPIVVVGARYDARDMSGPAMLVSLVRALVRHRMRRTVRFVGFAHPDPSRPGSEHYAARLTSEDVRVHAMVSLGRLDLAEGPRAAVYLVSDFRSRKVAKSAGRAFRYASRVGLRTLTLPSWMPLLRGSDHLPFQRRGWRTIVVADSVPWHTSSPAPPDVDRMAGAVPGLVAAIARLAGGRA